MNSMVAQRLVRIREAKQDDLQAVLAIEYKCFPDPYPIGLLKRLHFMHHDGFLVADADGSVVGYVIGMVRWSDMGHVLAIGVDPTYRKRHVGKTLMKNIVEHLRHKGAKYVRLEVRKSNILAQHFYKKLGFFDREEMPHYYEDGETALAMELPLE